jgi:L-rhamnose mutarotase
MQLKPGCVDEYQRRHQQIWPELARALIEAGIHDYSIFLDDESLALFAVLRLKPGARREELALHPVMKRWWEYMAPLMLVEPDQRPVEQPLRLMFRLS